MSQCRFLHEGERIQNYNVTLGSFLEDGDEVDFMMEQCGC